MIKKVMNWLKAGRHRVTAAIILTLLLVASYEALGQGAQIGSMTGINGVTVNQSVEILDPRDGLVSYCTPLTGDDHGTGADSTCVHIPAQIILQNLQACKLVTVPERGPELVCGEMLKRYKKIGNAIFEEGTTI